MKRATSLVLFAVLGCIREAPRETPHVQPETTHATAHAAVPAAPAAPAAPAGGGEVQRLGQPITVTETTALGAIVQNPAQFSGRSVRTEGTVTAVCQAAGCWMQIGDAAQRVHVRMHGHSFFIPRSASGRRARVQGTVVGGNPNGHCEQEAAEATGQQVAQRLELDATGVELL
jgi:hypothetical protein